MRLIFRAEATADIRRIARETRKTWGEDQAKRYVGTLRSRIKALREFPLRYPEFEERPNLRRMTSGRHTVFYRLAEDQIEIIRILHAASDFEQWV